MDVNHRIVFRVSSDLNPMCFLEQNNIKYEYNPQISCVIVNILESADAWPALEKYISENGRVTDLLNAVYSRQEMNAAEWFTCRSTWRWEYPQPKSDEFGYMKNITYKFGSNCRECGYGKKQIGNFRVRKSPAWGKKNFLMLNWEEDVLFLSDHAKEILSASGLKGFEFLDVYNTKGDKKIEDINQLLITECTKHGLVWENNDTIREINVCETCGKTKYIFSGRGCVYKRDALPRGADITKSVEGFGFGAAAPSIIIVSKNFCDVIVKNNLDTKLVFEPLILV